MVESSSYLNFSWIEFHSAFLWLYYLQVAPNGWSEGEYKGNAGWFPSAYVERQDKIPASQMMEITSTSDPNIYSEGYPKI